MKSLFNKYESYTEKGSELSDEAYELIKPLIKKWVQKNYKIRDVGEIISDSVHMITIFSKAEKAVKMRKQEKSNSKTSLSKTVSDERQKQD